MKLTALPRLRKGFFGWSLGRAMRKMRHYRRRKVGKSLSTSSNLRLGGVSDRKNVVAAEHRGIWPAFRPRCPAVGCGGLIYGGLHLRVRNSKRYGTGSVSDLSIDQ